MNQRLEKVEFLGLCIGISGESNSVELEFAKISPDGKMRIIKNL
jgi:hypothetical protein